jgi:sulfite reductase beta subunit
MKSSEGRITDIGPPHYEKFLPPVIQRNYGKWKYHEKMKPGIMVHVSETGEKLFTVRAASPRLLSVGKVRAFADLADKYSNGYLRFTARHNVEFLLAEEKNIKPLVDELEALGHPIGGIGMTISNIIHNQGWLHCHSSATDASGPTKSLMDELFEYFQEEKIPSKVRIAVACCINMCGTAHCSDISIIGIHTKPPRIQHDILHKRCEIPTLLATCPTAAIRPASVNGKPSVEVIEDKCMYCGGCYTVCPAMPLKDPENDGVSIWVGGKVSNARSKPTFSKLVIPYLPNNPPRWPEVTSSVKHIIQVWAEHARPHERIGEWINRIGWPKFFRITGIPFKRELIDDYKYSDLTYRHSAHLML